MPQQFNVMLALQTPDGLAFGYVRDASRTAMSFTVNSTIPVGTTMAWRMELKGYSETIMGRLTVTRAYPAANAGEWPRYDAKVDDIPEEDLALLQVWMEDQEKGGSSRRMEKDPDRFVRDMFAEGMRSATAAQTKLVIDRMNERRLKREQMFKKKKTGIGGDFGLSHESASAPTAAPSQSGRSRISAALGEFGRRAVADEPAGELVSEPESTPPAASEGPLERPASLAGPPPPLPWAGVQPQEGAISHLTDGIVAAALEAAGLQSGPRDGGAPPSPAALRPQDDDELIDDVDEGTPAALRPQDDEELIDDEDEGAPAATPAPEVPLAREVSEAPPLSVDLAARPPRVRLCFTAATYGEQYRRHLRNSALFLPGVALGARGQQVGVELTLPSGVELRCTAQVVAALPSGTGLMLALTRPDRDRLAAEAG